MAISEARPWRTFLLGLLLFWAVDTAIFGSGWYGPHQSPILKTGDFWFTMTDVQQRPADPARDVLVLGHSRMGEGFSFAQVQAEHLGGGLHFVSAIMPGSDFKWWYFQLRALDPAGNRYRAVVIPVNGYLARPDASSMKVAADKGVGPALRPFLALRDWPAFIASFDTPGERASALAVLLFPGHSLGVDAVSWLRSPGGRRAEIASRLALGLKARHEYQGYGAEDLSGLRFDYASCAVSAWPAQFDLFRQKDSQKYLCRPADPAGETRMAEAYNRYWLQRIADLYRGTHTRVIVVPVPAYGVAMAGVDPIAGAPDIRTGLADAPQSPLLFLPEAPFAALARRANFYDLVHMNRRGRT
ncbi:MAG TPA: hypothetical protein VFF94_08425, partial [Novosphingobium sp.]|nr:hypothetical protein [Novosphingobium sp.]